MKKLGYLLLPLMLFSCQNPPSNPQDEKLGQELMQVADSISQLMASYHYNPGELQGDAYLEVEQKVKELAQNAQSKEEFREGFNGLWQDGPFSHVSLVDMERPATAMADFVDSLRVGDHAVSLEWMGKTALLTVTTMTGIDTKERVFAAFQEIAKQSADTLILDLRNNTGGTFAGVPLIGHIIEAPLDAGFFVSRKWWKKHSEAPAFSHVQGLDSWKGWSLKAFWHDVQEAELSRVQFEAMEPHFAGPVYVLISSKTASAAEFTADALANVESVSLIGERTAGQMLSQKMFDLPQGLQLSLPIAEYYSTRMGRIEGKGVAPDIEIDQSLALNLARALCKGANLDTTMAMLQAELDSKKAQPLAGEEIYLFGSMNDWGKNRQNSPQFSYLGKGQFEAILSLEKGNHEFKIAPMNWEFDFGAASDQGPMELGAEQSLVKKGGSPNLKLELDAKSEVHFILDLSNENAPVLRLISS